MTHFNFKSGSPKYIYFDYAATTPIDPKILRNMIPIMHKYYGNSMSLHKRGQEAKELLERSRESFAKHLNVSPGEIIFTGSATESNNFALKGIVNLFKNKDKNIIISGLEHPSVLNAAKYLENNGLSLSIAPVTKEGIIDIDTLAKLIKDNTILVSVIYVNNEIGSIQPIEQIGDLIARIKQGRVERGNDTPLYFHTDATQAFGKIPINIKNLKCDLLTACSHKIYGPKGAALLYIKKGVNIEPLLHGGGHEFGLRSSTVNIPAIFGFWKAYELALERLSYDSKKISKLANKMLKEISRKINGACLNGERSKQIYNILNFRFDYIEGESLVYLLDNEGIGVSTGSACASTHLKPSETLLAIGLKPEEAQSSIRVSLGRFSTQQEVDRLLKVLPKIIKQLRNISPYGKY